MELDPIEELWDLGRNKTIKAGGHEAPFMCSDPAKGECIVSCTETTTQSTSGLTLKYARSRFYS